MIKVEEPATDGEEEEPKKKKSKKEKDFAHDLNGGSDAEGDEGEIL